MEAANTRKVSPILAFVAGFLGGRGARPTDLIPPSAVWVLVPILWFSLVAAADCTVPSNNTGFRYSYTAREMRDDLYEDVCRESNVPVIIASDPQLKSRLKVPSNGHRLVSDDIYPDKARRLSFEGSVVVAFVVETDGSISRARVIQSSGHKELDYAATAFWKEYQFAIPGKFDGAPARVLYELPVNFKLKAPAIGLPASFSDTAITGLGDRILQPYARGDADALYKDLDETAKRTISLKDFQSQVAAYISRFGTMVYVQYAGLLRVKTLDGVPHYELKYFVECGKCMHGVATMMITAVDRPGRPGISSFEFGFTKERLK
jgi:TonB family protein